MSRLDRQLLSQLGFRTWKSAYKFASDILGSPPSTFKLLRDEFDPLVGNVRVGWHGRAPRPDRLRLLDEMVEVSDEALMALVTQILSGNDAPIVEALDVLGAPSKRVSNVAERLLTGRKAEAHFLHESDSIAGVTKAEIIDMRDSASGFDFGLTD